MYRLMNVLAMLMLVSVSALPAAAQREEAAAVDREAAPPADAAAAADAGESEDAPDKDWRDDLVSTQHTVTIDGKIIHYTATCGRMPVPNYQGDPYAEIFFIAYTRDYAEDSQAEVNNAVASRYAAPPHGDDRPADRPITFTFNGGPGSSSVWLHLGALGPRRVLFHEDGAPLPAPPTIVENPYSWLDFTDLVFIDPVSTGFSRPAEGVKKSEFHGLRQDIEAVGEFIRLYTTRYGRWESPKFLCGESYGTTRAAGLAGELQGDHGMYLNGITLVSAVLDFRTISFGENNDLPYVLFLPTYTATAWYHGKLEGELADDLEQAVAESEKFASGPYMAALLRGHDLPEQARREVAERLADLTGLSAEFIDGMNLRVDIGNFSKELLRDERTTVGRFDSRYTGTDPTIAGTWHSYDPSYAAIQGPFTAAINAYLRDALSYENDQPYEVLTGRVHPWDFSQAENQYVNVADILAQAMVRNPALHVLVAAGYYDLATPHYAADYTMSHLALPPHLQDNISTAYFKAGHMMYLRRDGLAQLREDARAMYEEALSAEIPNPLGRQ